MSNYITGLSYVDDLVIYTSSRYLPAIERRLQMTVDSIEGWTKSHVFKFSVSKMFIVHFHRKRQMQPEPHIELYNNHIKVEKTVKYLGVVFDGRLAGTEHIKQLKTRATKALDILKCVSRTKGGQGGGGGGDRTSLLRLYLSLIRSKLDYASFVYWTASESELKKLDPVHNSALRLALGAFRTSPVQTLYAESGEMPLNLRRQQLAMQYFDKIKQDIHSPVYRVVMDESVDRERANTFAAKIQEIRRECGLIDLPVYEVKPLVDPVWLVPSVCADFKPPKKTETNPLLMKQLFFQHIYENHRNSNHIYTDDSKIDDNVGCAVLHNGTLYTKKLTNHMGIYNAEIKAILKASQTSKRRHAVHIYSYLH